MINAPCVIIADFESDNKKCDEKYGGSMCKIAEQKANSFCYLVHWIDTGNVWGPFLYRGENATQEFVQRIDEELVRINEVLAIKVERIVSEEYKRQFEEAEVCWTCKDKFAIDKDEVNRLERKKDFINGKIKKCATEGRDADKHKSLVTTLLKIVKDIERLEIRNDKIWDHCHITGKFRGRRIIPVILNFKSSHGKLLSQLSSITSGDITLTWFVN